MSSPGDTESKQPLLERLPGSVERERLIAAQRREGLGLLAREAIHDFNNILAGILGCGELAREDIPAGSPGLEHVNKIVESTSRSVGLCQQMLGYASEETGFTGNFSLNNLVQLHERLLAVCLNKRSRLILELNDAVPDAMGDTAQIVHVLVNLVLNATEAIGSAHGEIVIATGREPAVAGAAAGRVFLEVRDNGPGIASENLESIFAPYFTTRAGRCGMGLTVASWLAAANGGEIRVVSEPGHGATFRVLLPVAS